MNNITEAEKAYLAGFTDGEGCINISKYQGKHNRTPVYNLTFTITQKNLSTLEHLCSLTGLGHIYKLTYSQNAMANMWQWKISCRETIVLLKQIFPYLRNKSMEAELAIEFQEQQGHRNSNGKGYPATAEQVASKEHYYLRLRELKKQIN